MWPCSDRIHSTASSSRLVGEHRSENDMTDKFDVRNAGLVTDHDAPAQIDLDADVFEVEASDVWPATDGDEPRANGVSVMPSYSQDKR